MKRRGTELVASPDLKRYPSRARQPACDLLRDKVGTRFDFSRRLILNRVCHIDGIVVGPSQCRCLGARGGHELERRDRDGRDPEVFELQRVVQTARGAGPSISQRHHNSIGAAQVIDHGIRGTLGEGWLGLAADLRDIKISL